jgi:hypothetical protein
MNPVLAGPLSPELLHRMDAYWRAANYLSVGQIYLYDNPLLKKPLELSHVKPLVVGHWGTTPGQNFIYVHLNRVIKKYDLDMFYIVGPGHGGPALVGNTYLEGTYSEIYPDISQDEAGLRKLFTQFSFPGGISRLRLPGPRHRQHDLQGRAAQRAGRQRRPDAAGPGQAGERPEPRCPGGRHRLHAGAHRNPVARRIAVPPAARVCARA